MANNPKKKRARIERQIMNGADAEFLLNRAKDGKYAIRVGRIWRVPRIFGESVLLLDYDDCSRFDKKALRQRLSICGIKLKHISSKRSPGGNGIHVAVTVDGTLAPFAIVALQCLLESDPIREAQNFRRALCMSEVQWKKTGNALFSTM